MELSTYLLFYLILYQYEKIILGGIKDIFNYFGLCDFWKAVNSDILVQTR